MKRFVFLGAILFIAAAPAGHAATSRILFERSGCDAKNAVTLTRSQNPTVDIPAPANWKELCPSCKGSIAFDFILALDANGTVCSVSSEEPLGKMVRLAKAVAKKLSGFTFPPARGNGKAISAKFHLTAIVDLP